MELSAYRRARGLILVYFLSWVFGVTAQFVENVPEDADITFEQYPLSALSISFIGLLWFVGLPVAGYYMSKDKRQLSQRPTDPFLDSRFTRHWVVMASTNVFTVGLYPLYYLFVRWRFNKKTDEDTVAFGRAIEQANNEYQRATRAADDGRYTAAIEIAFEAAETAQDAQQEARANRLDPEEATELHEQIQWQAIEWADEQTTEWLSEAEQAASESEYERAIELVDEILALLETLGERGYTGGFDIAARQRTANEYRRDWVEASGRSTLEEAQSAADRGEYEHAIQGATRVVNSLDEMARRVEEVDDELRETAVESRREWKRELLVSNINTALEVDPEQADAARTELEAVLSELPETEVLSDQERTLLQQEAREAYVAVCTRGARHLIESGERRRQTGDHDGARETFRDAIQFVKESLETAKQWSVDTAELSAALDDAELQYAETHIAAIKQTFETGIEQFEQERYDQASETFTAVHEDAVEAQERIGSDDARERLTDLAAVAEENAETTQRAALGIGRGESTVARLDTGSRGRPVTHSETTDPQETSQESGGDVPTAVPGGPELNLTYEALERGESIGKGGNADVYRATASVGGTTHTVALKEPRLQGTIGLEVVEEFVREAETWAKLDDHDHIVDVVDWETEPLPWIAMEHMDSGDLSERFDAPLSERFWIAETVTDAVLHAHRRGVAHLDLKPENILFRHTEGARDIPKVADWGLARMLLNHSKSVQGMTPRYAAPEQFDDDTAVGQPADIYQLGAVFYELFTGQPPFSGSPIEVVQKIADEPVTPPTEVDPTLPGELDDVLGQALAKDPADRYEDLLYLRDELHRLRELPRA